MLTATPVAARTVTPAGLSPDKPDPAHDAASLTARFLRDGFLPGVPPGLPADARDTDARVARRMRCPRCRGRCAYRPFHAAAGRYRILAACRDGACGGGEEL